jgi:hypothetical protein
VIAEIKAGFEGAAETVIANAELMSTVRRDNVFYRVGNQRLKQGRNGPRVFFLYNSTLDE